MQGKPTVRKAMVVTPSSLTQASQRMADAI